VIDVKKLTALVLVSGFVLIASGVVNIPHTTVDDAIAAIAQETFAPVGTWFAESPAVRNIAEGMKKVFSPVSEGVGEAASAAAGIPQRLVAAARRFPALAGRAGTNAKNSLAPLWYKATKRQADMRQLAGAGGRSCKSPLPLFILTGLFLAVTVAKNKRLPLVVFFVCVTLSFFYYL